MTEKLTVKDGRLKVERVEGKESLDIDLSKVDTVYFERSPMPTYPGALVLVTDEGQKVVRVDNDDAAEVMKKIQPSLRQREENDEARRPAQTDINQSDEPQDAPASEPASATSNRNRRASQKA